MEDKVAAMRLEEDVIQAEEHTTDSHIVLNTSRSSFDKSELGPPPLLHIGTLKSREQFKLSTICPGTFKSVLSRCKADRTHSEEPVTSVVCKKKPASFGSCAPDLKVGTCKSHKRQRSSCSPETSPSVSISSAECKKACPRQRMIKLKNVNLSDSSKETESTNCCTRPSSMSTAEPVADSETRSQESVFCSGIGDISAKDCSSSCSPVSALSASAYPQHRQPKLLK